MKLAMMQKTTIFTTFSAHTKMNTEKRGQDEVFGRKSTLGMKGTFKSLSSHDKVHPKKFEELAIL